jgi:hypothetical protein
MEKLPSWMPGLMSALRSALPSFVSAVIGGIVVALAHQYFAVQLEQEKALFEVRKTAYSKFIEGQRALQDLRAKGSDPVLEERYHLDVRSALFFIAVYSSKSTVDAVATFYQKYFTYEACPRQPQEDWERYWKRWRADVNIYQQIRKELFGAGIVRRLLYGSQTVDDEKIALLIQECVFPARGEASGHAERGGDPLAGVKQKPR